MSCLRLVIVAIFLSAFMFGGAVHTPVAQAQKKPGELEPVPKGSEQEAAAAYVTSARQYFTDQKYFEAAEALARAYTLDAKPLYLFNAGTAYRKAEKREQALTMYQRYIDVAPDGPLVNEARSYIKDLQDFIDSQKRLEQNTQALQGANQLLETERSQVHKTQAALESEKKRAEQIQKELEKAQRKPWYRRPGFIVLATVAVGAGLIVGAAAIAISQSGKTEGGTFAVSF